MDISVSDRTEKKMFLSDEFINDEKLTIEQVCELLFISEATAKNWIRLGKLKVNSDNGTFDKEYIEQFLTEIKNGNDSRLKSRRNKKNVSGKIIYKDYIKNKINQNIVEEILNSCEEITSKELRVILAYFAVQLYEQSGGAVFENFLLEKRVPIFKHDAFNHLIADLLGNIDLVEFDFKNIKCIFDCFVQFVPLEDTLGFIYISLRELNCRKQAGAYYTPKKAVNNLLFQLKKCVSLENKIICDPCCGTGNFLIGLAENGVSIKNLYGQDIDEISICIARINMFFLDNTMTKEQLYAQFVCENTLVNSFPKKFSIVLGNPPWGYNFSKEEIADLLTKYITAKKKGMDSYDLFIEKGLEMLEKNGYLAYLLPETVLNVNSHRKVRELIIKNTAFRFVSYLGDIFSGVQCPSIILGLQNGCQGQTKNCEIEVGTERFIINTNRKFDSSLFCLNINDEEYDCLCAISSIENAKYLMGNAKFALGIVTGNNKEYISSTKMSGMERVLKGSDIYRYSIKNTNNYIRFVPENFQQIAPIELYRAKEKLLYRFIAEVPVFAYDNQQMLSLNSCNILIPQIENIDIKYVLAVLNSSAAAYFFYKKYHSIKLLKSHIESLPIPVADIQKQNVIIKKVNAIMNDNKNSSSLYEELDREIMSLYGLDNEQQKIIKKALKEKNKFLL